MSHTDGNLLLAAAFPCERTRCTPSDHACFAHLLSLCCETKRPRCDRPPRPCPPHPSHIQRTGRHSDAQSIRYGLRLLSTITTESHNVYICIPFECLKFGFCGLGETLYSVSPLRDTRHSPSGPTAPRVNYERLSKVHRRYKLNVIIWVRYKLSMSLQP